MSDRELSQISVSTLLNSDSERQISQNSVSVLFTIPQENVSVQLSQISVSTLLNSDSERQISQNSVSVLFQVHPLYLSGSITGSGYLTGSLSQYINLYGSITGSSNISGSLFISGAVTVYKNMIYSTAF